MIRSSSNLVVVFSHLAPTHLAIPRIINYHGVFFTIMHEFLCNHGTNSRHGLEFSSSTFKSARSSYIEVETMVVRAAHV